MAYIHDAIVFENPADLINLSATKLYHKMFYAVADNGNGPAWYMYDENLTTHNPPTYLKSNNGSGAFVLFTSNSSSSSSSSSGFGIVGQNYVASGTLDNFNEPTIYISPISSSGNNITMNSSGIEVSDASYYARHYPYKLMVSGPSGILEIYDDSVSVHSNSTNKSAYLYPYALYIEDYQVVTSRQPPIDDLNSSSTTLDIIQKVNEILEMLRAHGLIET